jgi:hypothetical protein
VSTNISFTFLTISPLRGNFFLPCFGQRYTDIEKELNGTVPYYSMFEILLTLFFMPMLCRSTCMLRIICTGTIFRGTVLGNMETIIVLTLSIFPWLIFLFLRAENNVYFTPIPSSVETSFKCCVNSLKK